MISRALIELYSREGVARAFAFRGGTALHKLFLPVPARYSEDIDLVQRDSGAIGPALAEIRSCLDSWLGEPTWKQSRNSVALVYRFDATGLPIQRMRLKVEINTREHFALRGWREREASVANPWFSGNARIVTYSADELLATKLRALYQRRNGRDLYDLALALDSIAVNDETVATCFAEYLSREGNAISRVSFEANLQDKLRSPQFLEDIHPLLPAATVYDPSRASEVVRTRLIARLA